MNKYSDFKIHPVAEIFPLMDDATYQHLKADIAENGQWEMIMMHDEQIIDGRNRLRACCELGIEPNIGELPMELDPYNYAVGVNLHRRHLTTSQRSDVAGRLATLKHGEVGKNHTKSELQNCNSEHRSLDEAAELLNVSKRSVSAASYVHDNGCKELKAGLSSGEIPVSLAEKFAKEFTDKHEQAAIVKQGVKAIREAMKPPSIRKTAKGSEKVSEDKKPQTQTVVPKILPDEPKEMLPEEKTLSDWCEHEILEYLVSTADDAKRRAKALRKAADKLDPPTKFQKPDLDDVAEYFRELKAVEPESFFDFYESKGWLVGKVSMKDWRASARKWVRENANGGTGNGHAAARNTGRRGLTADQVFG